MKKFLCLNTITCANGITYHKDESIDEQAWNAISEEEQKNFELIEGEEDVHANEVNEEAAQPALAEEKL